jgi:hypothetical protein
MAGKCQRRRTAISHPQRAKLKEYLKARFVLMQCPSA